MISVLILTHNEEANLPTCLESVKWSDDIIVLDSFSSDRTVDIAKAAGARVIQRKFDNEKNQRTFSLREVSFRHSWVYNPDADEVTPTDLSEEMLSVVDDPSRLEVAYRVRFKTLFMGRWIRYSSLYPTWVIRLFRPERVRFEREINLRYVVDGPEGRLKSHYLHYSFNKGLNAWMEKHNRYSWQEAEEAVKSLQNGGFGWHGLVTLDPMSRRRALKDLSFRLPFRPTLRFLYMYFLRLGILDGWPGLTYCRLLSIYEYMIVLKMEEIRRRKKGLPL